jgi:hypothetical protein
VTDAALEQLLGEPTPFDAIDPSLIRPSAMVLAT